MKSTDLITKLNDAELKFTKAENDLKELQKRHANQKNFIKKSSRIFG